MSSWQWSRRRTHNLAQPLGHWTAFSAALWGPRKPGRRDRSRVPSLPKRRLQAVSSGRRCAASVRGAAGFSQNRTRRGTEAAVSRRGAGRQLQGIDRQPRALGHRAAGRSEPHSGRRPAAEGRGRAAQAPSRPPKAAPARRAGPEDRPPVGPAAGRVQDSGDAAAPGDPAAGQGAQEF